MSVSTNSSSEQFNIQRVTPRDHIKLIRNNIYIVLLISISIFVGTIIYSYLLTDEYTATTTLRIADPNSNILKTSGGVGDFGGMPKDRFIADEILTLTNITILKMVAQIISDSLKIYKPKDDMYLLVTKGIFKRNYNPSRVIDIIAGSLSKMVTINQPMGLDFIDISVTSSSPHEAALIANSYAEAYRRFNLMDNRKQFSNLKDFLLEQRKNKLAELVVAENTLKDYQLKKGVVELPSQASKLINDLSEFESRKNASKIEASLAKERLDQYKKELTNKDPTLSKYLESKANEPYLKLLQEQIAKIQTQKDIALTNKSISKDSDIIKEYDFEVNSLKEKLNKTTDEYQSKILAASPDEISKLTQKIFEENVNYGVLITSSNQYDNVLRSYESKFNSLPASALDLARLERDKLSLEKLYTILEQKYQEALVNEQATPGTVLILSNATVPGSPSGPDRKRIPIIGLLIGLGLGLSFLYIRNYFDTAVKSPEDITNNNINVIGWIPEMENKNSNDDKSIKLMVEKDPNSIAAEAFRTLRTRIESSRIIKDAKILLVTSPAPAEGKSFISTNLAASFACANIKTVILDADLRKPTVHSIFQTKRSPGLMEHLLGQSSFDEIIRKYTPLNLFYITSGNLPHNPSEVISSIRMKNFLIRLRNEFEMVIIDSPPVMAVSDTEVLSKLTDMSILVSQSKKTKMEWIQESVNLLKNEKNSFSGVLLNRYNYKLDGYKSNYKYYNYYNDNKQKIK